MQNQILGFFIITTVALGVLCGVQWRQSAQLKEQRLALQQQVGDRSLAADLQTASAESLQQERDKLRRDLDASIGLVEQLQAATNRLGETTVSLSKALQGFGASGSNAARQAQGNLGALVSDMFKDPSMKEMIRSQQEMMFGTLYGPLFKELNLPEAEEARLRALLLERQMQAAEMGSQILNKSAEERTEAAQASSASQQDFERQIEALLGEDRYAVYKDYNQTLGERLVLNQFRTQLDGSDHPLDNDQYTRLMQTLRESSQAVPAPANVSDPAQNLEMLQSDEMLSSYVQRQETINRHVLGRAEEFLGPEQLQSLAAFQTNQLNMMRLGMEMGKKMMSREGGAGLQPAPPNAATPAVVIEAK